MEKPSFFEVVQAVLALVTLIGSGVLVATGVIGTDPFTLIVGVVLGYYFGQQSGQSVRALSMALWRDSHSERE